MTPECVRYCVVVSARSWLDARDSGIVWRELVVVSYQVVSFLGRPGSLCQPSRESSEPCSQSSFTMFRVIVHHVPSDRSPCSEPVRPSHESSFTMFRGAETMFWQADTLFSRADTMFSGSGNHVPRGGKCVPRDEHHVLGMKTMFSGIVHHVPVVVHHVPGG
jgi:hypothetical protein